MYSIMRWAQWIDGLLAHRPLILKTGRPARHPITWSLHRPATRSALARSALPRKRVRSEAIRVALVASVNRPHVRFASESDRIAAQQRNDAQCHIRSRADAAKCTARDAALYLLDHFVGGGK